MSDHFITRPNVPEYQSLRPYQCNQFHSLHRPPCKETPHTMELQILANGTILPSVCIRKLARREESKFCFNVCYLFLNICNNSTMYFIFRVLAVVLMLSRVVCEADVSAWLAIGSD
jgi:hypothetical protein